ncbi:radical SAM protein [Bacteriovoracaceae bacterium]|nr:radical SAM protein [Bacteriovoracaceae bacterium]
MNKYHKTPIEILANFNELELPTNFCIVPFSNIILNPGGDVSICRQKGTKHIVGNLNNNSIEEIWNSEYLRRWREEFLTGNVKICEKEIRYDQCHLSSGSYFFISEVKLDINQESLPLKLTANFNGQCNLKCKMCDVWTLSNGYYDQNNYWEDMRTKFFPYIKEIELLSGEPFIQKDTWRLIDEISVLNPDCVWSFTTNGNYKFSDEMFNKLSKIKIKNIIYSIDSLDIERFSKIRVGGDLNLVLNSLEQLRSFNKQVFNNKIAITLHFLLMKDNWDELENMIDFCSDKKMMFTINVMTYPEHQSVLSFDTLMKRNILEKYIIKSNKELERYYRALVPIIDSLDEIDKANYYYKLKTLLDNKV